MSHVYVVLGAGKTGKAAAYDLARFGRAREVRLVDRRESETREGARRIRGLLGSDLVRGIGMDAGNPEALSRALAGADAVLSCLPYWHNSRLAKAAVAAGAHFADLGGNTQVVREELALDGAARSAGVSIVPDCGLAPGLVNTLAAAGIQELAACRSVKIRCGGLPQEPRGCLGYALSFSISGLVNEYTGMALCLRNGEIREVPALSEVEPLNFEGFPSLEAFVTTGGSSTAPQTFASAVQDYDYKTIRYRGHLDRIRCMDELGLFSLEPVDVQGQPVIPRRLFEAVAGPRLEASQLKDIILARVTCRGRDVQDRPVRLVYELVDRSNEETGFSAMERCTSFPAALVSVMQAHGEIESGARPLEVSVPAEPYLERLKRRDLNLIKTLEPDPPEES